jgi:hypothetical protein
MSRKFFAALVAAAAAIGLGVAPGKAQYAPISRTRATPRHGRSDQYGDEYGDRDAEIR